MLEDGIFPLLELLVAALDGGKEWLQISIEAEDVLRIELRLNRLLGHCQCSDRGGIKASQRDEENVPNILCTCRRSSTKETGLKDMNATCI